MGYEACIAACKAGAIAATLAAPPPAPIPKTPIAPVSASTAVSPVALTANEVLYIPVLKAELQKHWPESSHKSTFAAQIYKETCPSLRSTKCFNPKAELKTDREYGFGLGQLTVTGKFDNFKEARKLDTSLKDWKWEDRYNPEYQLRTMVLMDKFAFGKLTWADSEYERMAFMFSAYNGGLGGVLNDRAVCRATPGCDPNKWFGHVENTSRKAKVAAKGYGQSFFQINRGYVKGIMGPLRVRYKHLFGES
jgi:hypothetical protein